MSDEPSTFRHYPKTTLAELTADPHTKGVWVKPGVTILPDQMIYQWTARASEGPDLVVFRDDGTDTLGRHGYWGFTVEDWREPKGDTYHPVEAQLDLLSV